MNNRHKGDTDDPGVVSKLNATVVEYLQALRRGPRDTDGRLGVDGEIVVLHKCYFLYKFCLKCRRGDVDRNRNLWSIHQIVNIMSLRDQ